MILEFARAALERFRWRRDDYFVVPSLEEQDSTLNLTSLARSAADVPDPGVDDNYVGAVLNFDYNRDLEGALGINEVDKDAVKRPLQKL